MVRLHAELKQPCSSAARAAFGPTSKAYKRIKALEQWALKNGYKGYKAINRRTKKDKEKQTNLKI